MGAKELREQLIKKIEQADEKMLPVYSNALENAEDVCDDWADTISPELKTALLILKEQKSENTYSTDQVLREAREKYGL